MKNPKSAFQNRFTLHGFPCALNPEPYADLFFTSPVSCLIIPIPHAACRIPHSLMPYFPALMHPLVALKVKRNGCR
jgi:hypothetical protein